MRTLHFISLIIMLIGGMASCKTEIDPGGSTAATLDSNKVDIMTYATSKGLSGTMTTSGLYYVLTKPGSSTVTPAFGQELEFNYKSYVLNGPSNTTVTSGVTDQLIDSAYATTPIFYPFFENSLRPGLEEGFRLMREGDQVTLLLPSVLAFGNVPSPDKRVPANSPVRYDITLRRARTEDQQISDYITATKLTVTEVTTSGLRFIKTLDNPTGALPTANQTLGIRYKGKLVRAASAFDSTGSSTYATSLGKSPIAGFNEGLAKLRVGEKATLIFPSALGLKAVGSINSKGEYDIPPNAPLRYDIELVSAQ